MQAKAYLRTGLILAGVLMVIGMRTGFASSFTVSPVRIDLSAQQPTRVLKVQNLGDKEVMIQTQLLLWNAHDGKEQLQDSQDLIMNPPIIVLPPHGQQYVRIGLRRPNRTSWEQGYRLVLEEVPSALEPGFSGLRTLLRLSIPVFAQAATPTAPKLVWAYESTPDGKLIIKVVNQGNAHTRITRLEIATAGSVPAEAGRILTGYLLPGQSREWVMDTPLVASNKIQITAVTDKGTLSELLDTEAR